MTLDVVTSGLVAALLVATSVVFVLGLLGELGVLRRARCPECDRHVLRRRGAADHACAVCRHDHLAHPVRVLRHPVREFSHR
ncbi:MAG TPA: hypothetical protein VJ872_14055 [Nocardioides sp.]|nr:hypothetical protein [Nocardioides sp.]